MILEAGNKHQHLWLTKTYEFIMTGHTRKIIVDSHDIMHKEYKTTQLSAEMIPSKIICLMSEIKNYLDNVVY